MKLKKKGLFSDEVYQKVYPSGSQPARIYGLPKIHKVKDDKEVPPFRPIISSIGTYNYGLSSWLCGLLTPLIPTKYTTKDTFSFVNDIRMQDVGNKVMVSFDVVSLFTNIPLRETVALAVDLIKEEWPRLHVTRDKLTNLFLMATAETHFIFNGSMYDQVDGVAMGSPLGPILANLFMGHHERRWLNDYSDIGPSFYRRYVDDIFCIFQNQSDAEMFLNYINMMHPNIKFTMETEVSKCLSFLDVTIKNMSGLSISVYRKKTFTGLLTNFFSYTTDSYKIGLIKNLLFRAFHICDSWGIFHKEVERIYQILLKNSFPRVLIDRVTCNFVKQQVCMKENDASVIESEQEVRYFKLPYRGRFSDQAQSKHKCIAERFCKPIKAGIYPF